MSGLFLLEVNIRPCNTVGDIAKNATDILKKTVSMTGGTVFYCFKVIGENRFIAVIKDGVEAGVDAVNTAHGEQIDLTCIPIRAYESFSKSVLGVEEANDPPSTYKMPNVGTIFWMKFLVEQKGLSQEELLAAWKKEALAVMSAKKDMKANMDVFKESGKNVVHALIETADHDSLDNMFYSLPINKLIGGNVHTTVRRISSI